MSRNEFDKLLNFIKLTNLLQKVERVILVKGKERRENDSEHSFQLTLVAWYLIEKDNLRLDKNKVIQLALVHDLVETYAGDTYIYDNPDKLSDKENRERKAAKKLKTNFPEFGSLHELIEEYEKRESPESRFVYALDKVLPTIYIYLDHGRTWKKMKIRLEKIKENKSPKVALSKEISPYWKELLSLLENNPQLFKP